MKVKAKIWLEEKGRPVFGDGRCSLLEAIGSSGSIKRGAERLGMSYKHAWDEVALMESRMGLKLLDRRAGGRGGGGVSLTRGARDLVAKYRRFERSAFDALKRVFENSF